MSTKNNSWARRRLGQIGWVAALCFFRRAWGCSVTWRVPGLELYARNWLTRTRGPLPVPDDIAIVAIDEASLVRFGRYPWRRNSRPNARSACRCAPKSNRLMCYSAKPQTMQTTPPSPQRLRRRETSSLRPSSYAGNQGVLCGSGHCHPLKGGSGRWTCACFD